MPSLKTLRSRIRSVKNTRQITRTMKMVAAAKVRRARGAVENARPYAARLAGILGNLAAHAGGAASPLLAGRGQVRAVALVVCGSDRGLCGSLNSALIKEASQWVQAQQAQGRAVVLVASGRKIRDGLRTLYPQSLVASYTDLGRTVEFAHAQTIAADLLARFESGAVDEVHLMSSHLVTMLSQVPQTRRLLPFPVTEGAGPGGAPEYEPGEEKVLQHLLPLNLNMQVFTALLETAASEQAARMAAMDSATRNAGEMIKRLSIQYNRSRQAAITKELIEIISGAEAL